MRNRFLGYNSLHQTMRTGQNILAETLRNWDKFEGNKITD